MQSSLDYPGEPNKITRGKGKQKRRSEWYGVRRTQFTIAGFQIKQKRARSQGLSVVTGT